MNKKYMIGTILVLLISTFALGCVGNKQGTPTPIVTPLGTTEQVTPVGTTEQVTPVGTATSNTTSLSGVAIEIKNSAYNPLTVTISQGETVTWTNNDAVAHTATSVPAGIFDSGIIRPGTTYSYTFNQAGTFEYSCSLHPSIPHGTITVTSTGISAPTPMITPVSTGISVSTPMTTPVPTSRRGY